MSLKGGKSASKAKGTESEAVQNQDGNDSSTGEVLSMLQKSSLASQNGKSDLISYSSTKQEDTFIEGSVENIKVFIRIRPLSKSEIGKEEIVYCSNNNTVIKVQDLTRFHESQYNLIFGPKAKQKEIFDHVKFCVNSVIQGFNSTLFAYGQTGSGKTYTIFGQGLNQGVIHQNDFNSQSTKATSSGVLQSLSKENELLKKYKKMKFGLIPRIISDLFKQIKAGDLKCTIYVSFLQIYNENVYDLLQESKNKQKEALKIREEKSSGVYVEGLQEIIVTQKEQCFELLMNGEKIRARRQTRLNMNSSRSHSLFQILIESDTVNEKGMLKRAKLNIGDLAGSEKIKLEVEFPNAQHLSELKNINLSLTTLGKVIQALSIGSSKADGKEKNHIPFRDSKLTRLLQDSLEGNTRTCIIATVSPTVDFIDETISTLRFADRAKSVSMKVHRNEINAIEDAYISKLQKEITCLKDLLKMRRKGDTGAIELQLFQLKEENERLRVIAQSAHDVEILKQENKRIKIELQNLKTNREVSESSESDIVQMKINSAKPVGTKQKLNQPEVTGKIKEKKPKKLQEVDEDEFENDLDDLSTPIEIKKGSQKKKKVPTSIPQKSPRPSENHPPEELKSSKRDHRIRQLLKKNNQYIHAIQETLQQKENGQAQQQQQQQNIKNEVFISNALLFSFDSMQKALIENQKSNTDSIQKLANDQYVRKNAPPKPKIPVFDQSKGEQIEGDFWDQESDCQEIMPKNIRSRNMEEESEQPSAKQNRYQYKQLLKKSEEQKQVVTKLNLTSNLNQDSDTDLPTG